VELQLLQPTSSSASLTGTDAESGTLTPASGRNATLNADVFGPPGHVEKQRIAQESSLLDAMKPTVPSFERQSLLRYGTDNIPNWPTEPARLCLFTTTRVLGLVWNIMVTLLPLLFIAFAIIVHQLNNKSISDWGEQVVAASRLGPTIFPIMFTLLVGRSMKSLARYLMEKGPRSR